MSKPPPFSEHKVLVIDDHPLVREALKSVLEELIEPLDYHGVGSFDEGYALVQRMDFDLILLDLHIPGAEGLSALVELRAQAPATPTVVVSYLDDEATVHDAIACGASGFIPKSLPRERIANAIRHVLEGGLFTPACGAPTQTAEAAPPHITQRQSVVLQLMMQGHSNKYIAYKLNISEWTVKAHVSAILRVLKVHNRVEAVLAARRLGLDSASRRA
ncbi:MAG TPA: response regulator transcription factor [Candidatus Competibacteraceae bacterium]|nr:response regulator transcription factor [Candidatus Competibacteraceae bacterium]